MILYFPQQSFYKHVPRLQRTKRYEDTQNYLKTWSNKGDVCHSMRLKATGTLCANIFFKFDFQILKKQKQKRNAISYQEASSPTNQEERF